MKRSLIKREVIIQKVTFVLLVFLISFRANAQQVVLAQDIQPGFGSSFVDHLTVLGTDLFFTADDGFSGVELWKTNGVETTLFDINPDAGSSSPDQLIALGADLFFTADDGTTGIELWKYDSFMDSVVLVKDINPGANSSTPLKIRILGTDLYFTANDGTNGVEFWKHDGINTTLIDVNPGAGSSSPKYPIVLGSNIYFQADDGSNGIELWRYDGSTLYLIDINSGSTSSSPEQFAIFDTALYFSAKGSSSAGRELWKYDPIMDTAMIIQDINLGVSNSSPKYITEFEGSLYFQAKGTSIGKELWQYDPMMDTTILVLDINLGSSSSFPQQFLAFEGYLYFTADDGNVGRELWRYDSETGATMVKDLNSGSDNASISDMIILGTDLYFAADDGINGKELWKYSSVDDTMFMVSDIRPLSASSDPDELAVRGADLYFSANDGINGSELWKTCLPTVDSISLDLCESYVSPSGKYIWSDNGIYSDTITNTAGCDSIITIILSIRDSLDVSVTANQATLTANFTGATSYQWIDCNNENNILAGDTNQSFTATINGDYAVIITQDNCSDTSECNNIGIVGINEGFLSDDFIVYPNPNKGQFLVEISTGASGKVELSILDIEGRVVYVEDLQNDGLLKQEVDLGELHGLFWIILKTEIGFFYKKLILI